jgi:hypothetical protein
MRKSMDKLLKWIHFRMPLWVSGFYMPLVYLFRHINSLWVKEFLVEGKLQGSESVLRLGYFGNDKRIFCYYVNNLFSEAYRIEEKQKVPVWKISSTLARSNSSCELAFTEVTRFSRGLGKRGKGYILPRWVDTLLNVENSLDAVNNKKVRKNISKHCFTFRESRSDEDLRFFYERMFKPYIMGRHKDASVMVDFSYFRKRMRKKHSKLFFLMQGDEPVVASFNEKKNGRMKFSGLGVLDGRRDIIQMGAIRSLYYFMLNQYRDQGTEVINYGGTSPLLSDGLTKFKRSLRAIPTDRNPYGEKSLWLIPVKPSEGLNSFLYLHPFLYLDRGRFYRALFPNAEVLKDRKEFLTWLKHLQFLGIEGTRIYCRDHTERIRQWISEASLEGYEVLACGYLLDPDVEAEQVSSQQILSADPVQRLS